ncbi:hypothetical protein C8R43DRAFT_974137 [Mycena crocata]|nr:hypothetical protein C8R43DRAFT_974137 [Mycena crocata]
MPRRAAARLADVPQPDTHQQVAEHRIAQNLATLRTSWKWAAFSQFFFTFSQLFNMDDVALNDIEDDLTRDTTIYLPRVMARLLFVLSYDRKVSLDNWQSALRKQHKRRDPASNPIGPEPRGSTPEPKYRYESVETDEPAQDLKEDADMADADPATSEKGQADSELPDDSGANTEPKASPAPEPKEVQEEEEEEESKDWLDLPMQAKLDSMHLLTEWQFQNPTRLRSLMKSDDEDATWRIEPIGYDAKSNAYWLIGADRLWIQRVQPRPPRYTATASSLKRKRPEKPAPVKSTSRRGTAKRARLASVSEESASPPRSHKKGAGKGKGKNTITVPGRAAKAQAKLKLDAQAKELAEINRAAGLGLDVDASAEPSTSTSRRRARNPVAPIRPLGTRVSSRLRGSDDEEWQAVPEDWLEEGSSSKQTKEKKKNGKGKQKEAKTGLESDEGSISDLTELSEDGEGVKEEDEEEEEGEQDEEEAAAEPPVEPSSPAAGETPAVKAEDARATAGDNDGQPEGFVEWETICVTLFEWEHIADRWEKATHYAEKALYKALTKEIMPVITEELREIERKRRLEEAIVHRKRSSRIANKESEKEEARLLARQKAEVAETKSRAQRLEARLAKEEAERERREAAREQRRKEKEEKEKAEEEAEEESAEMEVDVVGNDSHPPPTMRGPGYAHGTSERNTYFAPQRNGTATASTSTSGTRTPMGDDWVLNCEICHRSGVNVDDGMPMLCCGICSQWQHIACHDHADVQAGRPRRNWDQVDFICRQCQTRRMAAKNNARQYQQQQSVPPPNSYTSSFMSPMAPSTSYASYPPSPPIARAQREHTQNNAYPIAVNGAATYTPHTQPSMSSSRQLPYPAHPAQQVPANYHRQVQHAPPPPPPRLSAGPAYSAPQQQPYPASYDRGQAQFQPIASSANLNGHRAPAAYQRPPANNNAPGWNNMPPAGYAAATYAPPNGVPRRGDNERHQYGDNPQWHAGGSQQAAFQYHNGQ